MTTLKNQPTEYQPLSVDQINMLERQGCFASHWSKVLISSGSDLRAIRQCRFSGEVRIGIINPAEGDLLINAKIADCVIGDNPYISNVHGELRGLTIGRNVRIENVGRITAEPEAAFGVGTEVAVLDETGSRPVVIYPGLTSQMAVLMAMNPKWADEVFSPLPEYLRPASDTLIIGDRAEILDCRVISNVRIGHDVHIHGAAALRNGTIVNNATAGGDSFAYVGTDVDAADFIIEDGRVESGALLRHCYVGQGVTIAKRFTAHDSLFFANSALECGEACAIIAGPYTVSMHKSSLLIGALYSFFNAGSGTNASNHKYKLGPVHWGIMHRGVKTSSDAYIMWDGGVGAFSLLMGAHKRNPDTSLFPFCYLFADSTGTTIATPGLMLRSCGLSRDELKWPNRDNRRKHALPLLDNITFDVLNPLTIQTIIKAIAVLEELLTRTPDAAGYVEHQGIKMTPRSVERGIKMYVLALCKYLTRSVDVEKNIKIDVTDQPPTDYQWVDMGGQIMPKAVVDKALELDDAVQIQELFNHAFTQYRAMEAAWKDAIMTHALRLKLGDMEAATAYLDSLVEADRKAALQAPKQ